MTVRDPLVGCLHDEIAQMDAIFDLLVEEIDRQDTKHGPFIGTRLGKSRLAIACLEDEIAEAKDAWRSERKADEWSDTTTELLQVAAVAIRAIRDMGGEAS